MNELGKFRRRVIKDVTTLEEGFYITYHYPTIRSAFPDMQLFIKMLKERVKLLRTETDYKEQTITFFNSTIL